MLSVNATREQLNAADHHDLCDHVIHFTADFDPCHPLNKIHARNLSAALVSKMDPRAAIDEASDERDSRIGSIGDALETLIDWALGG